MTNATTVSCERAVGDAMRIVTRCTTIDQFVAAFARLSNPTSCFIPGPDRRAIGTEHAFSIQLADGTQVIRGRAVVIEVWGTADNPFERPGMYLGFRQLSPDSAALLARIHGDPPPRQPEPEPVGTVEQSLTRSAQIAAISELSIGKPTEQMQPIELAAIACGSGVALPRAGASAIVELPRFKDSGTMHPTVAMSALDCALVFEDRVAVLAEVHDAPTRRVDLRSAIETVRGVAPVVRRRPATVEPRASASAQPRGFGEPALAWRRRWWLGAVIGAVVAVALALGLVGA